MNSRCRAGDSNARTGLGQSKGGGWKARLTMNERSTPMRRFRPPTRVLVVSISLLVVAASVLAVTASAQSGSAAQSPKPTLPPDEGTARTTGSGSVPTARSRPRTSRRSRSARGSSMPRPLVRRPWTVTSSSTPGAARRRPVTARSNMRAAAASVRSSAGQGPSMGSVPASTSRTWAGMTMRGTGRTGSRTTDEEDAAASSANTRRSRSAPTGSDSSATRLAQQRSQGRAPVQRLWRPVLPAPLTGIEEGPLTSGPSSAT